MGKVFLSSTFIYIRAMMAFLMIFVAFTGMMTDTGARPHVVHGPDNRFSRL
jgi:hypothetical protein